jgi:Transglutaminase-like superfamily
MSIQRYRVKFTRAMWLRLWRRPRAEKWLAMQSMVLCLLSVIALRLIGFGRWKGILWACSGGGKLAAGSFSRDDIRTAEAAYAVVDMVARNIPWGLVTCLPRSLTLWWILRRRGVKAELRMGVRRDGERIVAHAWVVCHGTAIGEPEREQFLSLESAALAT